MKTTKLNKAQLKEELSTLINTVNADYHEYERALLNNETYDDGEETWQPLDKSARIMTMLALANHDHIMRKLCELSRSI